MGVSALVLPKACFMEGVETGLSGGGGSEIEGFCTISALPGSDLGAAGVKLLFFFRLVDLRA